jgi:hypothetical protein
MSGMGVPRKDGEGEIGVLCSISQETHALGALGTLILIEGVLLSFVRPVSLQERVDTNTPRGQTGRCPSDGVNARFFSRGNEYRYSSSKDIIDFQPNITGMWS